MKIKYIVLLSFLLIHLSCKKDFLDAKPNSNIITPETVAELQAILDYTNAVNLTGGLSQASSDEFYIINKSSFDALEELPKNAYLWRKDLYSGADKVLDWNEIYTSVFYANSVLDGVKKNTNDISNDVEWKNLNGAALFLRAYSFYDLARNFCTAYNESTASNDLGIPLRLSSGIDVNEDRSTLKETYDRIIIDLNNSKSLLRDDFSTLNRNRPSKSAVSALLARIYLSMGKFNEAEKAADDCLSRYNKLINYNQISVSSLTPFSFLSDETIFYSRQSISYSQTTAYGTNSTAIAVDPELISLYESNDLRLSIFFVKNALNNLNVKRGYVGSGSYAFTGLATDEVLLIKAECLARRNEYNSAMEIINLLLINRYKIDPVTKKTTYINQTAVSGLDALDKVLKERRKELVWRGLRWHDLKRLNIMGANIVLKRNLDGVEYTLQPNSPLYVFPIPDYEIALSGIKQNNR